MNRYARPRRASGPHGLAAVPAAAAGTLQVYELSAQDGSIINLTEYPVTLTPLAGTVSNRTARVRRGAREGVTPGSVRARLPATIDRSAWTGRLPSHRKGNHMLASHRRLAVLAGLALLIAVPGLATASHSWGNYHWARTSNPFTLMVGDNVGSTWDSYLNTTISDWSQSSVLNLVKVAGKASGKQCRPSIAGRVEVCNGAYGNNGWLGVAQIWASGSHITKGSVRNNDTYFNTSTYNTSAWRNLVMCQEVGHTLGLNHQDENFNNANLNTCMDYTNNPSTNQHPNAHDYAQLESIYSHLDSTTTVGAAAPTGAGAGAWHSEFGRLVASSADGRTSTFVRDLGNGMRVITHVIWA